MKYLLVIFCFSIFVNLAHGKQAFFLKKHRINDVSFNCIYVDLKNPRVEISPYIPHPKDTFKKAIHRLWPDAAINGTYFQDYKTFKPISTIMINKQLFAFSNFGTAMGITLTNNILFKKNFHPTDKKYWQTRFTHILAAGPRIIDHKKVTVHPYAEGFKDIRLFKRKHRSVIGVTKKNKYFIMVTTNTPCYLSQLARCLVKIGVINAMNLDGGSSTAMFFKNKLVTKTPLAKASNLLVVNTKSDMWWHRWKRFIY